MIHETVFKPDKKDVFKKRNIIMIYFLLFFYVYYFDLIFQPEKNIMISSCSVLFFREGRRERVGEVVRKYLLSDMHVPNSYQA